MQLWLLPEIATNKLLLKLFQHNSHLQSLETMAADSQRVRDILKFIGLTDSVLNMFGDKCLDLLGSSLFVGCHDDECMKSVLRILDDKAVQQFFDDAAVRKELDTKYLVCKMYVGAAMRRYSSQSQRPADVTEEEETSRRPAKKSKKENEKEKRKKRPEGDRPSTNEQKELWTNWVVCGTRHQGDWGNVYASEQEAKHFVKNEGQGQLWKQQMGAGSGTIKYISEDAVFKQGSRLFCKACWNEGVRPIIDNCN
jgi:hypothetical protein